MINLAISNPKPAKSLAQSLTQLLAVVSDPTIDFVGLRRVCETTHYRRARNGKLEPQAIDFEDGVMVEVATKGSIAYCGTADVSSEGLRAAFTIARELAEAGAGRQVFQFKKSLRPISKGEYRSPRRDGLDTRSLKDFNDFLCQSTKTLKVSDAVVNAQADAMIIETEIEYVTSVGTHTHQNFLMINSNMSATATKDGDSQTRSLLGPRGLTVQAGLEAFEKFGRADQLRATGEEAVALISAPNCPSQACDIILLPSQMYIQIHESIGHPLELDRILGDERNFAGWSFVKPQDFGKLRYGSSLMNVSFDPGVHGQFASYAFDDGGTPSEKQYLIREGVLERGLGGLESQARLNQEGVANFRAAGWNRAPIDRMANINVEPGTSNLQTMIEQTENGIMLDANVSWSIDDYRNKFQFGCEVGYLVKNGKKLGLVKNPSYRSATVPFWSSLAAVGSANEVEVYGSPYCGKGEPSQVIRVGHSAPPCLFKNIEIFGGGK